MAFLLVLTLSIGVERGGLFAAGPMEPPTHQARVAVPVADLRKEPIHPTGSLHHDPLEESQLLYGDPVQLLEGKRGWARVCAINQPEWSHNKRWEGYPGWIESSLLASEILPWNPNLMVTAKWGTVRERPFPNAPLRMTLSLGTRLLGTEISQNASWWKLKLLDGTVGWIHAGEVISLETLSVQARNKGIIRSRLVGTARLFLNDPYYWGGRSAYNPHSPGPPHTAIDCSGLVGLVYQASGLEIPRDAHEQWMKSRPITREALAPGDLIFLTAPQEPNRVTHVMLYSGNDRIIEAPGTGRQVREISLDDRLLEETATRRVLYGTYLE